jgi:hypothetical protein
VRKLVNFVPFDFSKVADEDQESRALVSLRVSEMGEDQACELLQHLVDSEEYLKFYLTPRYLGKVLSEESQVPFLQFLTSSASLIGGHLVAQEVVSIFV